MMEFKTPHETERELKEFWSIDELEFTGQYALNRQGKGYFTNIRKPNGSICFYPDDTKVTIPAANIDNLEIDREYILNAFVAPKEKRETLGVEYLLYLDTKKRPPRINQQTPKQYVQKLYNQYQAAEGILKDSLSGAIKRLAVETNKKSETFIYEILQNADDYPDPNRKEVDIHFKIIDNYLVVLHNGQPFKENNVYAICSVATGDKERDIAKTGFKGIGFKSLFKHSNYVWIHSGPFSFRFDEAFHKSKGNETFWQLIPVWTEIADINSVLNLPEILESPVSIVIKPIEGRGKLLEYEDIMGDIFQDERLLLFLRTIKSITFQGLKTSFSKEKSLLNWEISDLPYIRVPIDVQTQINAVIDKHTDDRIPEKFKDIESTRITFATELSNSKVIPTNGAKLYVYLPTDLDFGFSFLINGDFIPDGSRDRLFWDLDWNKFLFEAAGFSFVEWLQSLYLKYRDADTIKLIPDIDQLVAGEHDGGKKEYLLLFKEGMIEGFRTIPFIPDTSGQLILLEELLHDSTGLVELMEKDYFCLVADVNKPIVHSSFSRDGVIEHVLTIYELGEQFRKENLIACVKGESFRKWLKVPQNNVSFIQLLIARGWLAAFINEEIFITQNCNLVNGKACYYDLGNDQDLIGWMNVQVLNDEVRKYFDAGELNLLGYNPSIFVVNYILPNKNISEIISNPENNLLFYQYLFKYYRDLPDNLFSPAKLAGFSILNFDMTLIPVKERKKTYILNNELRRLLEGKGLAENYIYLLDAAWYSKGEATSEWIQFWLKLGIREVTESSFPIFISEEIIKRKAELFSHYEVVESGIESDLLYRGNTLLWLFLQMSVKYLAKTDDKDFRKSISQLPVYTINSGAPSMLKECYLSKEYTGNNALENLAERHSNLNIKFVSEHYIMENQIPIEKWTSLFKEFGVKSDVKELLSHYLIPEIQNIHDEELISVTQLIFENRVFLEDKLKDLNLKIKTVDGSWQVGAGTTIGRHYSDSSLTEDVFPLIRMENTISSEYSNKNLTQWGDFFKKLGAKEFQSESEVISKKIEIVVQGVELTNYEDKEFTFELIGNLLKLHAANNLTSGDYKNLMSLHVLLKHDKYDKDGNDENRYAEASQCHFSDEFNPTLKLESTKSDDSLSIFFVSPEYINASASLEDLTNFFIAIGIKDDFYITTEKNIKRLSLNNAYIEYIDTVDSKIKSNGNGKYARQHEVSPWKDLPYKVYLQVPEASLLFWNKVVIHESFLKEVFGPLSYNFYYGPIQIKNIIEWFIRNNHSIPGKDGKCHRPSELYSLKLEKYIEDNSLIPAVDLNKSTYADKNLEEYLGLKMSLSLDLCIKRFEKYKDLVLLKKEGVWKRFINILMENKLSEVESACLKQFIISGSLPNQIEEWRTLDELYFIKDDFDLGVGNSIHLVHDDFKEVAHLLNIVGLSRSDFNPKYVGSHVEDFKYLLLDRLKFVALIKSSEAWKEEADNLVKIIKDLNFFTTKRINLSYDKVEPAIQNTDKNFFVDGNNIYYIGNWRGARAAELFSYLHESFGLKNISIKVLQDILLLQKNELFELMDEKKIQYPMEWRPSNQKEEKSEQAKVETVEEPEVSYGEKAKEGLRNNQDAFRELASDLTEDEVIELESLLSRHLSSDEIANTWIVALFRALKHYEVNGYNLTFAKSNIEEALERRMLEGVYESDQLQSKRVIVRSAKSGILRLNYQAWIDLNDFNTELFVVTGSSVSDFLIFQDQQSLALHRDDSWVAKIGGDDKYLELNSLINGDYLSPDKKFAPFQLLIRLRASEEYQSIFERIYNTERDASFNDLD